MHSMTFDDNALPTIMIADRDDEERCLLRSIFELKGFTVLEAIDGQQAFKLALQKHPDLILMDLRLPVVSGFTVIRRMQKLTRLRQTPIVAVSEGQPSNHRLAIAAGCAAHLSKPLEIEELGRVIDRLLRNSPVLLASNYLH